MSKSLTRFLLIGFPVAVFLLQLSCDKGITPPKDEQPEQKQGCPFEPVQIDDTTRQYFFWTGDTVKICKELINVRFISNTQDSSAMALAQNYGLVLKAHAPGSLDYIFQVPLGRRAEDFYTPYGKPQKINFGNETIVQSAFAIAYYGTAGYIDEMNVTFDFSLRQSSIDSINSLFSVDTIRTFFIAGVKRHLLRVSKNSPYSSFDMANLYHCLKEVNNSAANISTIRTAVDPCTPTKQ